MVGSQLVSERVVIQAPMSFTGSAKRIWKMTGVRNVVVKALLGLLAVALILVAWIGVACWYLVFGVLLVPFRLLRRGSRKRKRDELRHREMLAAVDRSRSPEPMR